MPTTRKAKSLYIRKIRPDIIFISSNSADFTKGKTGFGALCSVSLEYLFNEKISVGLEPSYSYLNQRFETPYLFSAIPEILSYKNHGIYSKRLLFFAFCQYQGK